MNKIVFLCNVSVFRHATHLNNFHLIVILKENYIANCIFSDTSGFAKFAFLDDIESIGIKPHHYINVNDAGSGTKAILNNYGYNISD